VLAATGEVEEHGEVEEEAEKICLICYDAVDGSKSCRFACCMRCGRSFHIDCVQRANLPSLVARPDCGTAPNTILPADYRSDSLLDRVTLCTRRARRRLHKINHIL
jgi:hypothetical protein